MTDPGAYAGQQLTPEQEQILRARAAQQAAAEAAARGPAAEQASVAAQITAGGRGPLLPAEQQAEEMMALLRQQAEQIAKLTTQVGVMQKQQEEAQVAAGGPLPVRYAQAVMDGLLSLAVQHPDLGTVRPAPDGSLRVEGHFQPAVAAATQLVDAATAVSRGGPVGPVRDLAGRIERFITRDHRLATPKHVEYATVQHHLDAAVAESDRLAA